MSELSKEAEGVIGCLTFIVAPFTLLWKGFVAHKLWMWFAWPVTEIALSTPVLAGLLLLYQLAKYRGREVEGEPSTMLVRALLAPLFALVWGYVIVQFI